MNTQHHTEEEVIDQTTWELVGTIVSLGVYIVVAGFIAGNVAMMTSNITLVPVAVAVIGLGLAIASYLVAIHHARGIRSHHADTYRNAAGVRVAQWLGTVAVGLIFSLLQVESSYNDTYGNNGDGSVAHLVGGVIGAIGFGVWSYLVFTRPSGSVAKWIIGSACYLVAQAMPIGFAMAIGWLDAGHTF